MTEKSFDPNVWGPHFWFFLMTLAISYPLKANETTKKKYYDFITNLPLFIPHPQIGNDFSKLLDKYPVTPYLDSQASFVKWIHFIHNKYNVALEKPEMTMDEAMIQYYELYKPKAVKEKEARKRREKIAFAIIISVVILLGIGLYIKG